MNWTQIINQLFEIVIFPLLGVGTVYVCYLIKVKINELKEKTKTNTQKKYLEMLDKTITDAVIATNQTYVETLKKSGSFDIDAQKEAFKKSYETVMKLLTEEAKKYITEVVGDLEEYVSNKIEAEVNIVKI